MAGDADFDRELLARVRAGDDGAFGELFTRHADAVRRFALRHVREHAEADDLAAEAFFRVLQAIRRGNGPTEHVRTYLLTVARRVAWEWSGRRRDVPVEDEELSLRVEPFPDVTANRPEHTLISRAFTSLPERWRTVLWQVEVEGERPAAVAPSFGLSPNAMAALARRAREGLRAAYLQAHLAEDTGPRACSSVVAKLGVYTAGGAQGTEHRRIRKHLRTCSSCNALHAELVEVCSTLRGARGERRRAGGRDRVALVVVLDGVGPDGAGSDGVGPAVGPAAGQGRVAHRTGEAGVGVDRLGRGRGCSGARRRRSPARPARRWCSPARTARPARTCWRWARPATTTVTGTPTSETSPPPGADVLQTKAEQVGRPRGADHDRRLRPAAGGDDRLDPPAEPRSLPGPPRPAGHHDGHTTRRCWPRRPPRERTAVTSVEPPNGPHADDRDRLHPKPGRPGPGKSGFYPRGARLCR